MRDQNLWQTYPNRRIKPVDGMAVTATVWEEAHEYHRQQQRFHALLSHGPGILTGLEVIASDPPSSSVYIRPGIAIAPNGQTIIITEPVRYDFGQVMEGVLHLLLGYGEGAPRASKTRTIGDSILYIHDQFRLEAQHALPNEPYVELVRVRRHGRSAPLLDAQEWIHPGPNELDLRFRREIGAVPQPEVSLGVSYVGEMTDMRHGRGISYLVRFLSRSGVLGQAPVWVDNNVFLDANLKAYTIVCLVGQQAFQLPQDEMTALYNYLQGGGTIFFERCRRTAGVGAPSADESFAKLLQSFGFALQDLPPDHSLLTEPFLFAAPPPGFEFEEFETEGRPKIRVVDGIICSTYDSGCLWGGEQRGRTPSREEIRAALEWGGNIIAYAKKRHQMANGRGG